MRTVRTKPYLRQRLTNRISRSWRPYIYALVLWSAWAIASLVLRSVFGPDGLLYAMLLFGAIIFVSIVYVVQWLRVGVLHDRHWEYETKKENESLVNDIVSPRRPLPPWESYMANPELLRCLWRLIHEERPNHVVELGSGLSTVVMAYALEARGNGTLTSLDDHEGYAARTRRQLSEHNLDAFARVILTRLIRLEIDCGVPFWYALPDLRAEPPIDLLFVDGPMWHFHSRIRYPAMPMLQEYLADNATVVVDDTGKIDNSYLVPAWLAEYPSLRIDGEIQHPRFTVLRFSRLKVSSGEEIREMAPAPVSSSAR